MRFHGGLFVQPFYERNLNVFDAIFRKEYRAVYDYQEKDIEIELYCGGLTFTDKMISTLLGKDAGNFMAARETMWDNERFQMLSNKDFCLDEINDILEKAEEKCITKKDFHTKRVRYTAKVEKLKKSIGRMKQQIPALKKAIDKKTLEKGYVLQKIKKIEKWV